jgi:hypothetical protein
MSLDIATFSIQYALFLALPALSRKFDGEIMPLLLTTALPFLAAWTGDSKAGKSVPLDTVGVASAVTFFLMMSILQIKQIKDLLLDSKTEKLSGTGITVMIVMFIIIHMVLLYRAASSSAPVPI